METKQEINYKDKYYQLCELVNFGSLDVDALFNYIEIGKQIGYYDLISDSLEFLDETEINKEVPINSYIYAVIEKLFYYITEQIAEEDLTEKQKESLEKLKDDFNPFINACDSWFNNFLDEIDFSKDWKEQIIKELV